MAPRSNTAPREAADGVTGAMTDARAWLERIRALPLPGRVRIMNVCGGHERSITMAGLRGALPPQIELIPGPGCPVCVCPEEDIYAAIQLARRGVVVAAFGDMLRVPCNAPKAEPRSLEQARAAGGEVRPVSSPEEVLAIAAAKPDREVVFFAAGFETTTAPVAGLVARSLQHGSQSGDSHSPVWATRPGRRTFPCCCPAG
jgi:hydrogenase expression/formation protein HypD